MRCTATLARYLCIYEVVTDTHRMNEYVYIQYSIHAQYLRSIVLYIHKLESFLTSSHF
jgi:hypothetical protein